MILISLSFLYLFPMAISSQVPSHEKIVLRGFDGAPLTLESKAPYSPKKTCGACHDYNLITKGYHFQQGRTDGTGKTVLSDTYDPKYPWNLSSGLFGKHSFVSLDPSHLSRKVNRQFYEMDKSPFFFVQNCGVCHPGGGWGEFDRKDNLYYNEETKKFGYEISGDDPMLDGDYTPFSAGNEKFGASWDQSGVSEADCLICHLKGYQWKERGAVLRGRFFRYGPTVGAGWATLKLSEDQSKNPVADEIEMDYTKKEVADFENLHLQIVRRPHDENCWSCHSLYGERKKGYDWTLQTDIHKARGMNCISCHPGDKEHNFAKGNSLQQTVRDDLDNTMNSCEDCHYKRKDRRAPRYRHSYSPKHMRRIACQTCHLPYRSMSTELVYDYSSGEAQIHETSKYLSPDPLHPKPAHVSLRPDIWYPAFRDVKGKIIPVKPAIAIYWGDLDEKSNVVKPIPLWKIRELKKPPLKDDDGDGTPEVNSLDEIRLFLIALARGKDRFGNPISDSPVLIKGGFLYRLDKKGGVEKIQHDQAHSIDVSLNHNIRSGSLAVGVRGCKDCHARNSPFFLRKILMDPYDERGRPVYIEAWEWMGIDKEKLDRLLMEQ
ncbi:MAG: hypothetical protein FJ115_10915 [Deltaproteobacteria bacterium]|nr:hypothetical protein [Deltaproteobacteria bacterium]